VPRQGRERRRETRRAARRAAGARVGLPPSTRGREALGRWAGDRDEAPLEGHHDRRRGRAARRALTRVDARAGLRQAALRPRAQPGPAPRAGAPPPRLDRLATRARPLTEIAGG